MDRKINEIIEENSGYGKIYMNKDEIAVVDYQVIV